MYGSWQIRRNGKIKRNIFKESVKLNSFMAFNYKKKVIFAIIIVFFLMLLGIWFIILDIYFYNRFPTSGMLPLGLAISLVSFVGLLLVLIKYLKDRENFWKKGEQAYQIIPESLRRERTEQDITILKILKQKPILALPYSTSLILIAVFFIFEFKAHFVSNIITSTFHLQYSSWYAFLLYIYILLFILFSFSFLSYLSTAELMKRISGGKGGFFIFNVIKNYIYAIPFILIYSILWLVFFILHSSREKENERFPNKIISTLKDLSLYMFITMIRYFIFINLASKIFENKGFSFKDSVNFLIERKTKFFFIFIDSGVIFLIPLGIMLLSIFFVFPFSQSLMHNLITPLLIVFFVSWILFRKFSEQIAILILFTTD